MNGALMSAEFPPEKTGLEKAVEHFKTKRALARALGVEPMSVTHWFSRGLPAERAKQIVEATGGKISMLELRPDLFESADSSAA